MKKEYNIKDKVWIHMGESKLVEGRVVEIIDLQHLNEGHSPDNELYVVEIKTGIDDVYEVRNFDQISPDAKGPINMFRKIKEDLLKNKRYLNKVGVKIPVAGPDPLVELAKEINAELTDDEHTDPSDPTPDQINAAIERAEQQSNRTIFNPTLAPAKKRPARKNFAKRKKPESST